MKPTDEDVEAARIAAIGKAWTAPDDAPAQATIISAALEAYTPRLIERHARQIEHVCCDAITIHDFGDRTAFIRERIRSAIRSHLEKNDDA